MLLTSVALGGAGASCSSSDDVRAPEAPPDAGEDASSAPNSGEPSDSGVDVAIRDATVPPPFDGGPLPVVCDSAPCATSLETTIPSSETDRAEGYSALLDDGTEACWGANGAGQLGRGNDGGTFDDALPARVEGLSNVVGLAHTCALDATGGVWCWGTGPYLRNDAGARTTERTPLRLPLPPATSVGVGLEVGCAVVDTGILCWGKNTNAQLAPLASVAATALLPPRAIALPSGAPARDLLVGKATIAVREDGVAVSWGANPPLARESSLYPDPYPMPIDLGGVTSMDMTSENGCLTAGGIGYCWGTGTAGYGSLNRPLPEPVVAPEPLVRIATTMLRTYTSLGKTFVLPRRWCGVGASGTVYCWGINPNGQAGDGTKETAYDAVKVEGLPAPAADVRALTDSTCALLTNGKVYCWGSNYYGQLGDGRLKERSLVPVEVVLP